ncbi:Ig-like domain-containing protein [Geomonas sp. RF6]|uniref:Ig-like domain-containing protein n=1 Tax=Geomonas sp. RF6 TaxID=2897342 RepID=UPI001E3522E0|nr:Ig-like domain-containing protein [Geomonas sp. RF6]UFS71249.1 Ig-like domain-containing protein [Geomonas sp. RF6]
MKPLKTALFLALLLLHVAMLPAAQAAPGDFLYLWGARYHFDEQPHMMARDAAGNIYLVNHFGPNSGILVFDKTGTLLRKWSGYGSADGMFQFPLGIAVAPNGNVYVPDAALNRVQIFDNMGNFLGKWGSAGSADGEFNSPQGVAVDSSGNVYVSDAGNGRIQVFDPWGRFLRKWGTPGSADGQLNYASGVAIDAAGNVYVADSGNNRVQVFDSTGRFLRKWGRFDSLASIALDGKGNVYVTAYASVQVFDSVGTPLRRWGTWGSANGQFGGTPYSLVVGDNGDVYVADSQNFRIEIFSNTGTYLSKWWTYGSGPGEFHSPRYLALDSSGNVYVTDADNFRVEVFTDSGTFVRQWGGYGEGIAQFRNPTGIALDPAGNIYVADAQNNNIQIFNSAGTFLRKWGDSGSTLLYQPGGLAIDGSGLVYIAETGLSRVQVYDGAGTLLRQWASQVDPTAKPLDVALDTKGNVYAAYPGWVEVYDSQGNFLRAIGEGTLSGAAGVAVDPNGNVLVSTGDPVDKLFVFDPGGTIRAVWGGYGIGNGLFINPTGIVIDKAGNKVFVADTGNNRVQVLEGFDSQIPFGWLTRDIGNVGLTGRAGYMAGTFTIAGSGADIYGTADAFRYVYQPLTGDGQIVARVVSLQNTYSYAKGGVMIRESLTANSAHAMVDVTPLHGVEFSRRASTGGTTAVTGATGVAPYWVKLVRKGSTFSAYASADGRSWTLIGTTTISMANSVYIGLIVSSHNNALLNTATFDNVALAGQVSLPTVAITSPAVDATFVAPATVNITASATAGIGASVKQVEFYAGGTPIGTITTSPYSVSWRNVPAGQYLLTAVVTDTLGGQATSGPVAITVTDNGLPTGWRNGDVGAVGVAGSASWQSGVFTVRGAGADIWGSADAFHYVYQTMTGDGEIVARIRSLQNTHLYAKGGVMMRESLSPNSRHVTMDLKPTGGAEFLQRTVTGGGATASGATASVPYWVKLVRKGSTFSGYVSNDGATWRLAGSSTISMTSSIYVGLIVCSHNTSLLATATMDGVLIGGTTASPTVEITAPTDGTTYSAPASITVAAMARAGSDASISKVEFYAGGASIGTATAPPFSITWSGVPAGRYSLTARVTDSMGRTATSTPVAVVVTALPVPWLTADVGSVGVPGNAEFFNNIFTLRGSGSDIWGSADAFRFVYRAMTGNGEIIARVMSLQPTHEYAKGGVMMRESLSAGSKHALMNLTPLQRAEFLRRTTTGGTTTSSKIFDIAAPYWVRLVRNGSTFTGYISSNGVNWVQVGTSTISMPSTVYVGLVVASHDNTTLCTSTFDHVQMTQ